MIIPTPIKISIVLAILAVTLVMPDTVYGLLETIVVGLFELLEGALDEIIEHLFHTSRHTTQIIVFYLMWAMFMYGAYRLLRYLKRLYTVVRAEFPDWWLQQCELASATWHNLPLNKKYKMISGCSLGAVCFAMLMF